MQSTNHIMMIRPVAFYSNEQTAESNAYQKKSTESEKEGIQRRALEEFDNMVAKLRSKGVKVHVFDDRQMPATPDSIFPNNWVSFHQNGSVILYPMEAINRRNERRMDILDQLKNQLDFNIESINTDLVKHESGGKFLEGTGSLILDRVNKVAYASISSRTHPELLQQFSDLLNYEVVSFHSFDGNGQPIYHTNVMMSVGTKLALVGSETVTDSSERAHLLTSLKRTHQVVELSNDQLDNFAGNMLEVKNERDESLLVMSSSARNSLCEEQLHFISQYVEIVDVRIPTIETYGGGSARCMMAEVFLPQS